MNYLILDNGAGSIKYGHATDNEPNTMPNCTAKIAKHMQVLVGDEVQGICGGSQLTLNRPFDRGYLTNWNVEKEVWNRIFSPKYLNIDPKNTNLVLTNAPFTPDTLANDLHEVVYEEYGFDSLCVRPAAWFSAYEFAATSQSPTRECSIVIDSGFSFTHVMPFIDLKCIPTATKRLSIGGKLLTNYLKELVSYRQWNMMDETLLINQVKEALCCVSDDYWSDLQQCKIESRPSNTSSATSMKKFFVLPDFVHVMKGYVQPDEEPIGSNEQVLTMLSERFSVPEVIFTPQDIGLEQAGLPETTYQSILSLELMEAYAATANIIFTGGNANIPNLTARFDRELRSYMPCDWAYSLHVPTSPMTYAWQGAARFARDEVAANRMHKHSISKKEYMEKGHEHCREKFVQGWHI